MIIFLLSFLIGLILLSILAEKRMLPIWGWLILLSLVPTVSLWLSGAHIIWFILLCLPCWLVVLIFTIPKLRLRFITEPCSQRMQDALSQLTIQPPSQAAWQQDLMVGKLPEIERTVTLNSDERNFLTKETTLLCQAWQESLQQASKETPSTKILDLIIKQGFNRLRLSESSGGRSFSRAAVAAILTQLASHDVRLAQLIASLNGGLSIERYGSGPQQRKHLSTNRNKRYFIYHMNSREIAAAGIYGVMGEGNYGQKVKEGIHLHYQNIAIPDFVDLVELIVPCYDPKESSHQQLCFLIPYEMLADKKTAIFVPLSQALLNDGVIPFIQRETSFYTTAFAYASLLNLTHQASAGMAALECLGTRQDLSDLAGLSNELACLDRVQELSLQLLHQGEHLSEVDIHTNITDSTSMATMFGMRLSADHSHLKKALLTVSPNSYPPLQLGLERVIQLHQYWYALYDNAIHQRQKEDQLLMDLLAHSLRNLLRCWLHGLVWIIQPYHRYRQQQHLVLAFSAVMDVILINRILFMSPFPHCDRAWHSLFLVLATQLGSDNTSEWKAMMHKNQQQMIMLLDNLAIARLGRSILRWILFPWGNNYHGCSVAENELTVAFLMTPSHERQEVFKLLAKQIPYHQQGEELLKLASLVKPIYAGLAEKNLTRTMDELSWYEALHKEGHITSNDVKIMKDFYLLARVFLADHESS